MAEQHPVATGHETADASVRGIVYTGVALAIGAALVISLVYGIFRYMADHPLSAAPPNPMAATEREQFPPTPRLEVQPTGEVNELRRQEDQILNTYGWTDKANGIARIPIDRAMELELQHGFPTKGSK